MGPGASTSQVVTYEGIRGWSIPDSNTNGLTTPDLNCEGFVGTSTAVVIAQPNFGSNGNLPDIADWKFRLTDSVNRIPGDTAAWVFGFTGSNSSFAACTEPTTFQSASTLQLKLPGTDTVTTSTFQYWQVWAKCTSTGNTQPGSIDLARLPGVYAGP